MDAILQGLMEVGGVSATMVLDDAGQVVAHRGRAIYDRALCEQVGRTVVKAIESIQLQQDDWETVSAQFADGRILLRRVSGRADGPRHVLAVVADSTLNPSFATVALRVAANKVRSALDGTGSQVGAGSAAGSQPLAAASPVPGAGSSAAPASDSRPVLANTGVAWTRSPAASSTPALSSVVAADPASAAFLARCAKELARHVGPIAKVFVQEAARRVSPDAPFAMALSRQLVEDLAGQVEDAKERAQFRKAVTDKG
jgi:predicted regulator of Ras-like GTPase activity (Roadblock/LC7/MglB family)